MSLIADAASVAEPPPGRAPPQTRQWPLLARLQRSAGVKRDEDVVRVRRGDPAGCFLYGPYWHLATGTYRLHFTCRPGPAHFAGQPVLGIEVLVLSRFQLAWRDFTAAELTEPCAVTFSVPPELSADGGNEGRFEFRFFHLGNAALTVAAIELERLADDTVERPDPRAWRLLGRLTKSWLGRRERAGTVAVRAGSRAGLLLYGGWPYLRLGRGVYRLTVELAAAPVGDASVPVLGVAILGRSRWQSDRLRQRLTRRPNETGTILARRDFRAAEIAGGRAEIVFEVPTGIGLEAGADAPIEVRIHHFGAAGLTIATVDLAALAPGEAPTGQELTWLLSGGSRRLRLPAGHYRLKPEAAAVLRLEPASRRTSSVAVAAAGFEIPPEAGDADYIATLGAGLTAELTRDTPDSSVHASGHRRKRLVFIGNCQCSILSQAFNHTDALSRQFESIYHFVQLQPNLFEFAQRDIEACDVLLIQDIDLWNHFPLQHCIRPDTEIVRFPLVRFASLWPFDAWNGPGDRAAYDSEGPNSTFPFRDGLLGRLREAVPDREARFRAYRDLDGPGIVNYRRLHDLEERRLLKMDQAYECEIGAFILDNFRARPIFHTTVRPNWQGFNLLLRAILKAMGMPPADILPASADHMLRIPQVPVHPKVAADLGVRWADEKAHYLAFGREMTWEAYIRRYIEHYG